MSGKRTWNRDELPEVLKDPDLNQLVTGVLETAKSGGVGIQDKFIDAQIDRTVEDLRRFFPEAYAGGDGGNAPAGGNVSSWPTQASA